MQSKKSFFNFTVFSKNIGRTWLIALGTTIVMFLAFCINLMTVSGNIDYSILQLIKSMGEKTWYFAVIIPMVVCVIIFSYLQKSRSISFYHSLPVCRRALFISNVLSGLAVMYIPVILVYVFFLVVSKNLGFCPTAELTQWLVIACVEELFYFSIGVFAMIIVGNSFVAIGIYAVVIFLPEYIFRLLENLVKPVVFGYAGSDRTVFLRKFSPRDVFDNIEFDFRYDMESPATLTIRNFTSTVIVMFLISLTLLVLAVLIYRKRKSEASGDILAVKWFSTVATWCPAFFFAVLMTSIITGGIAGGFLDKYSIVLKIVVAVSFAIFGFMGYNAVSLLVPREKLIIREQIKPAAIFTAFMLVFGIGFLIFSSCIEKYSPDTADISEISVAYEGNTVKISQADLVDGFKSIHKKAVEGKTNWLKNHGGQGVDEVSVNFTLKSGRTVCRNYCLSKADGVGEELLVFCDDNFMRLIFGDFDYNQVIICPSGSESTEYGLGVGIKNSPETARRVYDALSEDVEAGRIIFSEALNGRTAGSDPEEIIFYVFFMNMESPDSTIPVSTARGFIRESSTSTMKVFKELIEEYGLR